MPKSRNQPYKALMDARDAAAYLSISTRTLWTYTQGGTIPVVRIGRSVRYSLRTLDKWIASQAATTDRGDE